MRIYLVGFMGSGKTHWGRRWANTHQWPFYDLDEMIATDEQQSIEAIFEQKGEEYFRMKETMALHTTLAYDRAIIACGGGTPCFHGNIDWMNEHGFTVYLSASPTLLLEQIMLEKDKRPLLKKVNEAELLFFIEQKLAERQAFYHQAKLTLPVAELHAHSLSVLIP